MTSRISTETESGLDTAQQVVSGQQAESQQQSRPGQRPPTGLSFERRWTRPEVDPFEVPEWQKRDALIRDAAGRIRFEQKSVEVPAAWSQTATNVVASKYFRGELGTEERESSIRQLLSRVVDAVTGWGREAGYFASPEDGDGFRAELVHLLLHQKASFNSPVWFNVGVEASPQCSACFINAVQDDMPSILGLVQTEGMLFKYGSGSGCNLSPIRSSRESLAGGGTASGPVSFMRGFDAFAGAIKSGGKTRRAAKMVMLDVDHPDILDFVRCKELEEKKAQALIAQGYDGGFDVSGGAYDSVLFQNANHSVRVGDDFMKAVVEDRPWQTRAVTSGKVLETLPARSLMRAMAQATWTCGDPGMQFDTTINAWNTCPASGRINASNPCSEFMFLDDSACNLASLNLLAFYQPEVGFDVDGFRHACEILITAQDILIASSSYPTPTIARNSLDFRPLGLGYANLGALLMACGLPYDSDAGRSFAAAITALLSGSAYAQSGRIAAALGPFPGFEINREAMGHVLRRHRQAAEEIDTDEGSLPVAEAARQDWDLVLEFADTLGLRNSQISVLAPTGTIAFMMDCDTTGIEPDIALVKYKSLVGGGVIKMVNRTLPMAFASLGYTSAQGRAILDHLEEGGTLEGAPDLAEDHLPVFDCSLQAAPGARCLSPAGHLNMMAAVQPFLSGAISKTINMPPQATVDEIMEIFVSSWRLGLKAVAIYRDGCKSSQPLSTQADGGSRTETGTKTERTEALPLPYRHKLPDERQAITHKFSIDRHEGYLTVGLYEDGSPGEIFMVMAKEGSTLSGMVDAFATAISIALQYGVPLETLVQKFIHTRFEPSGFTQNRQIRIAKSITDYVFRWLASKFLSRESQLAAGILLPEGESDLDIRILPTETPPKALFIQQQDSPSCADCGSLMVRNGTCYQCLNCGSTSGCS